MKTTKIILASVAALLLAGGCNKNDRQLFDNQLYINISSDCEELKFPKPDQAAGVTEERRLSVSVPSPACGDIHAKLDFAPGLLDEYNGKYEETAELLPEDMISILSGELLIRKGDVKSNDATVVFSGIETLEQDKTYVAPVTLETEDMTVLKSKKTIFYVFRKASLINVVADVRENWFKVKWANSADVSHLDAITVEALVKVRNFDKQEGKPEAISTLFGIEGSFLIRIGDASIENNQVQLYTKDGAFPKDKKPECGLPENEWVHIAVVWDRISHDRIIYQNGDVVLADKGATQGTSLTLVSQACLIGNSYDNKRWLDGCISELRIWNRQRSKMEINATDAFWWVNPESEGLLAYWKFNDGEGNMAKDWSGNGNDVVSAVIDSAYNPVDIKWQKVSLPD